MEDWCAKHRHVWKNKCAFDLLLMSSDGERIALNELNWKKLS